MPTIPDKPLRTAATPTTNAGRVYVSPNRDEAVVKALLDEAWTIIFSEGEGHADR